MNTKEYIAKHGMPVAGQEVFLVEHSRAYFQPYRARRQVITSVSPKGFVTMTGPLGTKDVYGLDGKRRGDASFYAPTLDFDIAGIQARLDKQAAERAASDALCALKLDDRRWICAGKADMLKEVERLSILLAAAKTAIDAIPEGEEQ